MKKLKFSFFILLAAFLFSSNAFGIEGNIDVSGKIVAPSCALSIEGAEVDFGDDIVRTDMIKDFNQNTLVGSKFSKRAVLKVTGCTISSNKSIYLSVSGETTVDNTAYFVNSVGNDYAKNVYFYIAPFSNENDANKQNYGSVGFDTTKNIGLPVDRSTGEGNLFINVIMFSLNREPSLGLIKVPVSVAIYIP